MASPITVAEVATLVSELTVGVDVPVDTVTVRRYFGGGVWPVPLRSVVRLSAEIMADAVLDRRDFDRANVLDETGMRGLAVEGLEAARQSAGERERRDGAETSRPRH